jgi:hypothetical protein
MKKTLGLPLVLMLLVALASGFASHAAAETPNHVGLADDVAATNLLPFKGTLQGRHISRTPSNRPSSSTGSRPRDRRPNSDSSSWSLRPPWTLAPDR